MRLAKLSEFRRLIYAAESAPSMSTLVRHFEKIPGHTMHLGRRYIDLDEYDRATNLRANLAAQQAELARHPLLQGLMG